MFCEAQVTICLYFCLCNPFLLSFLRRFVEIKSNLYYQGVLLGFYALFSMSRF